MDLARFVPLQTPREVQRSSAMKEIAYEIAMARRRAETWWAEVSRVRSRIREEDRLTIG